MNSACKLILLKKLWVAINKIEQLIKTTDIRNKLILLKKLWIAINS